MRDFPTLINEMADFDGSKATQLSDVFCSLSSSSLATTIHALESHKLGQVHGVNSSVRMGHLERRNIDHGML